MKSLLYISFISLVMVSYVCFAGPVDINSADVQTLATELKGVGPAKAEAIVKYRNEHGSFKKTEELVQVKGIGNRTLEQNKENLFIDKKTLR
jgi:competence protein ComEA